MVHKIPVRDDEDEIVAEMELVAAVVKTAVIEQVIRIIKHDMNTTGDGLVDSAVLVKKIKEL